jgi:hypothetical protein
MFEKLGNFELERSVKQAFGFYISYLLLGFMIGFVVGFLAVTLYPEFALQVGTRVGQITGVIYCFSLALIIAFKKSLLSSFKVMVLIVLSSLIAVFLGALGGLIPVAYLTTRSSESVVLEE